MPSLPPFALPDCCSSLRSPEGQDGRLWKLENAGGQKLLMTVPPYLARSEKELLSPREVVTADRPR